jgi:hypothetical protein
MAENYGLQKVGHYTQIHMKFRYDHQFVQKLFGRGEECHTVFIVKFLKAVQEHFIMMTVEWNYILPLRNEYFKFL